MSFPSYLHKAFEEIDAAVFSGDAFYDNACKEKLRFYMGRWKRALDSRYSEVPPDDYAEEKPANPNGIS